MTSIVMVSQRQRYNLQLNRGHGSLLAECPLVKFDSCIWCMCAAFGVILSTVDIKPVLISRCHISFKKKYVELVITSVTFLSIIQAMDKNAQVWCRLQMPVTASSHERNPSCRVGLWIFVFSRPCKASKGTRAILSK